MLSPTSTSKEAPHGPTSPPPRGSITTPQPATVVPLEQLWTRIPKARQRELLGQLTRILAQRMVPPSSKGEANE